MIEGKKEFVSREHQMDCNDTDLQKKSLEYHAIDELQMNDMILDLGSDPKEYPGDYIAKLVNEVGDSCDYHISFGDVDFDIEGNEDLDFQVVPGPVTSTTDYSILFFKALVSIAQPQVYQFFKGTYKDANNVPSVKVVCFRTASSEKALTLQSWNVTQMPGT